MRASIAFVLLALALALPRLAFASDADLKKQLKSLEKENKKLSADLAKEQAASNAVFEEASSAETAAGLVFNSMQVYVPATKQPEAVPPVNVEYVRMHVRHADFSMIPTSFSAARIVANHRLYAGMPSVKRVNKR